MKALVVAPDMELEGIDRKAEALAVIRRPSVVDLMKIYMAFPRAKTVYLAPGHLNSLGRTAKTFCWQMGITLIAKNVVQGQRDTVGTYVDVKEEVA